MATAVSSPDDGDEGDELTPEQRERLQRQLQAVYKDFTPKLDIKVPGLVCGTSTISKIAADVARLGRVSMPDSLLKSIGMASVFAEQNARLVHQMKPILDSLTGWHRQITPVTSDFAKLIGATQPNLNLLGDQLTKGAYFGWNNQLAEVAGLYATQQANWLRSIAPALDSLRVHFFPTNLQGIEELSLEDIEQVVMLDGIALYEVPRAEIAERLVRALSSSARRDILGRNWREIVADCRTTLESCESAEVGQMVRFAMDAIDALEGGNATSAQSLAGSLVDTLLRRYLSKTKPLILPGRKAKNADAYLDFSVRKYIALAPIWQAYQNYNPDNGDRVPRTFNRHATAHTVGSRQYSRRNALQGLMLVCALLKFIDEQSSAQAAA